MNDSIRIKRGLAISFAILLTTLSTLSPIPANAAAGPQCTAVRECNNPLSLLDQVLNRVL